MIIPTRQVVGLGAIDPATLGPAPPAWRQGTVPAEEQLCAFARSFSLGPRAWGILAPHLGFDERQYRRVRLYRDRDWEGLLLCWLPGQVTNVHDHGGSVGISVVLSGRITEVRYERTTHGPLAVAGSACCDPGTSSVELIDTIHELRNDSDQPAVSLHMYSPPLVVLGAHDVALGTRWEVPVADSPDVQVGGDPGMDAIT